MSMKEECIAHIELQIDDINTTLAVLSLQAQMPGTINPDEYDEKMHALKQRARLMANTLKIVRDTDGSAGSTGMPSGDPLHKNFQHYM